MPREDLIQIRRGTASGWTSVNPTLANGEFGFETDTGKLKCGDGSSAWVELGYVSSDVSLQTNPVENEYANITALLADQGNQTETFFQYVIDASADPNVTENVGATNPFEAYYEKLATSTATLATDYRLLSDTETQIITDSNGYRVFRIQYIQDDSSPNDTATGGRIGFNYDTGTDKVTSVVFNNIYSNALDIFYAQRASNTYKLKFYNRNTGVYSFATVTGWTVNGNYYIVDVDSGIDISEISVNNRIELFFEIDNSGGGSGSTTVTVDTSTTISLANPLGNYCNIASANATTTYTTTGEVNGGWAVVLINTTSEPTVTGATKLIGATWKTGTDMYMYVQYNGTEVVYYFSYYTTDTEDPIIEDNAYGGAWNGDTTTGASKNALYDKFEEVSSLVMGFALGDETSDIETGTGVLTFQMPNFATTLTGVSVNLKTAPTGTAAIFDLNEAGTSVLSTKITIDAGDTTSETASVAPVISDASLAANAIMTVDIDQVGSTVAGVAPKMWIYFKRA